MDLYTIQIYWHHPYGNEYGTPESCSRLLEYINAIRGLHEASSEWYLQGNSLSEARNHPVRDVTTLLREVHPTNKSRASGPRLGIILGLWNGRTDDYGISLRLIDGWSDDQARNGLFIQLPAMASNNSDLFNHVIFYRFIVSSIKVWSPYWASALPFGYEGEKSVFRDRRGVGWMTYVNAIVEDSSLGNVVPDRIERLPNGSGTMITTTGDMFSADNVEHVDKANQIEIGLASMGLLPKI
jgi:hypothetical protein